MIITIDGPAGSGKSTAASLIAKHLNFTGWVKNTADNNVETQIQGEKDKILYFLHPI